MRPIERFFWLAFTVASMWALGLVLAATDIAPWAIQALTIMCAFGWGVRIEQYASERSRQ